MEDVWQFLCRHHSRVNCLTLCNLHVANGCHKCTVLYYCGVFSQSYWFPVKTCTQWLHSRGSGGGAVWNFRKRKSVHVSIAYLFMQIVFFFFASHAFKYVLFISLSWCCSYFLWARCERKGQRLQWTEQICLFYASWYILCITSSCSSHSLKT